MIRILSIFVLLFIFDCGPKEVLTISGSETMHGMAEYLAKDFEKENSKIRVEISGGGSMEGIQRLIQHKSDIALSSRELYEDEFEKLNKDGNLEKLTIAYDGVAIVVHPTNPISQLDLKSISEIFQGKITNWKSLGGKDEPIKVVMRNDKSGTLSYFTDHVLKQRNLGMDAYSKNNKAEFSKNAQIVTDNFEMADLISKFPNAIGFMGMGSALVENKGRIKTVRYANTSKDEFVEPSIDNVYNRKYRLSRGLYLIYRADKTQRVEEFATFLTGDKGQELILKRGYLRASLPEVEVKAK
jgi:phosphate transport system substrate-binding protein